MKLIQKAETERRNIQTYTTQQYFVRYFCLNKTKQREWEIERRMTYTQSYRTYAQTDKIDKHTNHMKQIQKADIYIVILLFK